MHSTDDEQTSSREGCAPVWAVKVSACKQHCNPLAVRTNASSKCVATEACCRPTETVLRQKAEMQGVSDEQRSERATIVFMPGSVPKAKLNSFAKARPRLNSESGAICMSVFGLLVSVPKLTCPIVCLTLGFSQDQRVRPCNNYYVTGEFIDL